MSSVVREQQGADLSLGRFTPSLARIETLSDGIFAIVLTLLALELKLPEAAGNNGFLTALYQNSGTLEGYFICFFIVGNLWRLHHLVTDQMPGETPGLYILNLLFLASVTLTPWSLNNLVIFDADSGSIIAFSGILMISWCLLIAMLSSALPLLKQDPDRHRLVRIIRIRLLGGALVGLISVLCALFLENLALYAWFLLIPYGYLSRSMIRTRLENS
ncbi:TMEM175 family protein [Fodinicurvata sediminis]|uniref:TMEM175 family protein n=1 Tax=Fodinicurvata sediminis TaxID=1121832 RepID=UPI0009DBBFF5|nr:TMEM175 family protein [Fodinicurvata sediminis]